MNKLIAFAVCLFVSAFSYAQDAPKPADAQQPATTVYKVGGNVTAPRLLHSVEAEFTNKARKDKLQGSVTIELIVDAQGNPRDVHVVKSLRADLDSNAVAAVQQYKFSPAMKGDQAVAVKLAVMVQFRLY